MFEFPEPAPRDIVPGKRGLTREALKRMNDMTGTTVDYTTPGEVLLDVDGTPNAVGPSSTTRAYFGGVAITTRDVERLGLTEDDLTNEFPNVRVVRAPDHKEK